MTGFCDLNLSKICIDFGSFSIYEQLKFHAQLSWAWKKFYNLGAWVERSSEVQRNKGWPADTVHFLHCDFSNIDDRNCTRNLHVTIYWSKEKSTHKSLRVSQTERMVYFLIFARVYRVLMLLDIVKH